VNIFKVGIEVSSGAVNRWRCILTWPELSKLRNLQRFKFILSVNMNSLSLFVFLTLLGCLNFSYAYIVTVDAHAEECFYEVAVTNTKMGKSL